MPDKARGGGGGPVIMPHCHRVVSAENSVTQMLSVVRTCLHDLIFVEM